MCLITIGGGIPPCGLIDSQNGIMRPSRIPLLAKLPTGLWRWKKMVWRKKRAQCVLAPTGAYFTPSLEQGDWVTSSWGKSTFCVDGVSANSVCVIVVLALHGRSQGRTSSEPSTTYGLGFPNTSTCLLYWELRKQEVASICQIYIKR